MTKLLMAYPASVNQNLFNLVGSHDTERIINKLGFNESRLRMLLALEFTFIGTPCIYYGKPKKIANTISSFHFLFFVL